jgi:ribosomal protein S18 acetylase RimI-like enzyme
MNAVNAGATGPAPPAVSAGCYGTGVSVREATPSDAEAIREVIGAAYREYAAVLPPVAFDGYLADLRALAVDPGARGLGIGRTLMEACRDRAVAAGATVLCLHTASFMAAAVAIYREMGFERVPEFDFSPTRRLGVEVDTDVKVIAFRLDFPAPG